MDELDTALLRLLQEDARRTNKELAGLLGIAESTCLERTRSLMRRGVITGVHARVDLQRIGRGVQALVAVRVRPPDRGVIDAFRSYVLGLSETVDVFVTTGQDDFLIHIAVKDIEQLNGFILDRLTKRSEIVDVRTSVVFRHERVDALVPFD